MAKKNPEGAEIEVLVAVAGPSEGAVQDAAWDTVARYKLLGVTFRYTTEGNRKAVAVRFRFDPSAGHAGASPAAILNAYNTFLERRMKYVRSGEVEVVGYSLRGMRPNPRTASGENYLDIPIPGTYDAALHVQYSATDWSSPGAAKTLRILPTSRARGIVQDLVGRSLTADDLLAAAIEAEEAADSMFSAYPQYQYRDAGRYYKGLSKVLTDLAASLQAGWRTNGKKRSPKGPLLLGKHTEEQVEAMLQHARVRLAATRKKKAKARAAAKAGRRTLGPMWK